MPVHLQAFKTANILATAYLEDKWVFFVAKKPVELNCTHFRGYMNELKHQNVAVYIGPLIYFITCEIRQFLTCLNTG